MGFESQLHEITHRLPPTRQSLLFSATLPTTVAEFAKASLTNPALIRLDGDSNLSPDLTLSFYLVRPMDKDAVLAITLQNLLRNDKARSSERKSQAIVFCATKHHVEYLATLIEAMGYRTSSVYGSLDQVARQQHLKHFRDGESEVLVVTDVAARGLDIPIMDNVINYDHPPNSRLFIHRVGRTARAGQKGRAVSLVTKDDLPYLCDLEAVVGIDLSAKSPLIGTIPRSMIDDTSQSLKGMEEDGSSQLSGLREVMRKGHGLYERSRAKASAGGYRKAKALTGPMISDLPEYTHADFKEHVTTERGQAELLAALSNYRPKVTVMELGTKNTPIHAIMNNRRQEIEKRRKTRAAAPATKPEASKDEKPAVTKVSLSPLTDMCEGLYPQVAKDYRDPEFYISHERVGGDREKG
jgi:ATP-dependent RNA helicase DDX54/DBP10